MVQQFKGDIGGPRLDFVLGGVEGDKLYGKIKECSGLWPSGVTKIYGFVKSLGERVSRPIGPLD